MIHDSRELSDFRQSRRHFLTSVASAWFPADRILMMSLRNFTTVLSTHMWRDLTAEGLERGELLHVGQDWVLRGTILRFSDSGPAEVRYEVVSDAGWQTKTAQISYRDDRGTRELRLVHEGDRWYANEKPLQMPRQCIDVDLACSPSTNTLPIQRLKLSVGSSSGLLTAAWIRLPQLVVEPLPQTYERTGQCGYIYRSRGGSFQATLTVDEKNLVVNYEGVWERVGRAGMEGTQ